MKSKTINVRLDKWIDEQINVISQSTGETKSGVLRAALLHVLTSKLNKINVTHGKEQNTTKKVLCLNREKHITLRISDNEHKVLSNCAKKDGLTLSEYMRNIISLYSYSSDEEYIQEPKILERVRKKNPPDERLIDFIRDNAKLLTNEVAKEHTFDEDSFQDTILLFITDPEASKIFGNGKLVAHFKYRYNMLLYRNTMNERERRGHNANDQQTKEDREEE